MAENEEDRQQDNLPVRQMKKKRESVWPTIVAGGVFTFLMGSLLPPSMGATRSVKLKWEERKAEIDQEIARQQANAQQGGSTNGPT